MHGCRNFTTPCNSKSVKRCLTIIELVVSRSFVALVKVFKDSCGHIFRQQLTVFALGIARSMKNSVCTFVLCVRFPALIEGGYNCVSSGERTQFAVSHLDDTIMGLL